MLQVGDPVGIMSLDQNMSEYYSQDPLRLGMGLRGCAGLDPAVQVFVAHYAICHELLLGAPVMFVLMRASFLLLSANPTMLSVISCLLVLLSCLRARFLLLSANLCVITGWSSWRPCQDASHRTSTEEVPSVHSATLLYSMQLHECSRSVYVWLVWSVSIDL